MHYKAVQFLLACVAGLIAIVFVLLGYVVSHPLRSGSTLLITLVMLGAVMSFVAIITAVGAVSHPDQVLCPHCTKSVRPYTKLFSGHISLKKPTE